MREYGKVFSCIWESEDFRSLSEDGRNLVVYLLTCRHGTIAGVFRVPDGYASEDLQWAPERVAQGFAEIARKGFASRCGTTKWVWVNKFLQWNPPENPNQRKSAGRIAGQIPLNCSWRPEFVRACGEILNLPPELPANPRATVPATPSEPFPNQEQEQEQEQEHTVAHTQCAPAVDSVDNSARGVGGRQSEAAGEGMHGADPPPGEPDQPSIPAEPVPPSAAPSPYGQAWRLLHDLGISDADPGNHALQALVDADVTLDEWRYAAKVTREKGRTDMRYVVGVIRNSREQAQRLRDGLPQRHETVEEYVARTMTEQAAEQRTPEQRASSDEAKRKAMDRPGIQKLMGRRRRKA